MARIARLQVAVHTDLGRIRLKRHAIVPASLQWHANARHVAWWALVLGLGFNLLGTAAGGQDHQAFCSNTAHAAWRACGADARDAFWVVTAQCLNMSDAATRQTCHTEAKAEKADALELCRQRHQARLDFCALVGEDRYDPDFSPAKFVHPDEIGNGVTPNPYFPLIPGTQWRYTGDGETNTVTVTHKTKLIAGVTCRVVRDVVQEEDGAKEETDDWFAQDRDGNVWYCGEQSKDFETFEGDDPEQPELVSIEGSFKAGRDGAKPGIIMLADPQVGKAYRQEFALGEAEDVAEVVSITGTEAVPAASCTDNCLVTRDANLLEPGANEFKYYAPNVGLILEIGTEGERNELVEVTTGHHDDGDDE